MANPLAHLIDIDLAIWHQLHHRAIGVGCARVLDPDEERAWRDAAIESGCALASAIATSERGSAPLFQLVAAAADSTACAIRELPRDRLAVRQALSDALAALLIVFAAAVTMAH